jgi:uncharacterized protein YndB with AHSA1/START domain
MNEVTAQVSQRVHASPERIWKALISPPELKQYFFGSDVESDFEVGSPVRMKGSFEGKAYEDKGEILEARPRERLSMSHWSAMSGAADAPANYHVVTFDLAPQGTDTEVTLTQSNLIGGAKPSDVEHRAEYEKNWRMVLAGLAKIVEA